LCTAAWDAVPVGEFRHQSVDAAGIEVFGPVQHPPIGLGSGVTEEDVDVAVAPGLEDSHRVIGKDTVRLGTVIDDRDDIAVDPVRRARVGRLCLAHRLGEQVRLDGEQPLRIVLNPECGQDCGRALLGAPCGYLA